MTLAAEGSISEWRFAWRRFAAGKGAMIGAALFIVFIAIALAAPLLAPSDPFQISRYRLLPPGPSHWFGTDNLGRDVLSSVIFGARGALTIGVLAGLTSLTIGLLVGACSGFYGGLTDSVLMRISEFVQIMPRFFLAILVVALLGGNTGTTVLVIGGLSWPEVARIVRVEFMSLKQREFVEAARAIGFGNRHMIFREILPNALPPALVQASLDVSEAVLLMAGLAFFGLSDPATVNWGEMLNRAQPYLLSAWWMSVFPGVGIFLVVLSVNLIGDGLNDLLNPTRRDK